MAVTLLAWASLARAQGNPAAPPTTAPAGVLSIETWALPPAAEFTRLVQPISRRLGLGAFGKDFAELRSTRQREDGSRQAAAPGAPRNNADADYTVYVPPAIEGKPYGCLVWISPGGGERDVRDDWKPVLNQHQLIMIAPHGVANGALVAWRVFMALEAVRQAKAHFDIDPDRVYVAGVSGGGRVASIAALLYPETIGGAFCMCGANFYKNIPIDRLHMWPGFWPAPEAKTLARARSDSRLVLLTGTKDMNHDNTQGVYNAFVADGFAYATFLDVPDMGHSSCNGEWLDKGIVALDAPLFASASDQYSRAIDLEKKHKPGEALALYERAARHAGTRSFGKPAADRTATLRAEYDALIAAISASLDNGEATEALAGIQKLRADWTPIAADEVEALTARLRALRAAKSNTPTR